MLLHQSFLNAGPAQDLRSIFLVCSHKNTLSPPSFMIKYNQDLTNRKKVDLYEITATGHDRRICAGA
jgi:hypothetical protein